MRLFLATMMMCLTLLGCRSLTKDDAPEAISAPADAETAEPEVLEEDASEPEVAEEVSVELLGPAIEVAKSGEVADTVETEVSAEPKTIAERFVEAGGQELCEAMAYGLSPEWRTDSCDRLSTPERRAECLEARVPLAEYATSLCKISIEEGLRFDLDPAVSLAVMERESSMGRMAFDRTSGTYQVHGDICNLYLSHDRILSRRPGLDPCPAAETFGDACEADEDCSDGRDCNGTERCFGTSCIAGETPRARRRREGTEWMVWTFAGGERTNRQRVRVVEEDESGVLISTCAVGEAGRFQLMPGNYRRGTVIEATGEVLGGGIRQRLVHDEVLDVRLGCQELARHRDMYPEDEREPWWAWVASYNTGTIERSRHWCEYTRKVMAHYVEACDEGWIERVKENGMREIVYVREIWDECERIRQAYEDWEFCEAYRR